MKKIYLAIVCLLIPIFATGCLQQDISEAREAFAHTAAGDLVIAFPGPLSLMKDLTGFYNGVMLAVEEINTAGGIHGRMIEPRFEEDKGTFNDGIKLAQEIALQEEVIAVVGHWNTYITLPAARIYNDAGVLMLSPIVSNPEITKKGYTYVFQNTINDNEMGQQMADYAYKQGYERIVVFYADNDYGRGLAGAFEGCFSENGGMVVDRIADLVSVQEFNQSYARWKAFDYDAVFVADSLPHAGDFIRQLRQMDSDIPIFAGDGLDMAELPAMLGEAAEGIVVATMYNAQRNDERQKGFAASYKDKYNQEPDVWAVQGYDSIQLLASSIQKSQTPSPAEIAEILRSGKEWRGVLGPAEFNVQGEMSGRPVYKKIVRNGRMEYLNN